MRRIINHYSISIFISVLSLLIVIAFIIFPAFNTIYSINREIKQQRQELEDKLAMGLNAKRIKADLDKIENSINGLDSILVKSGNELDIITQLEAIATKYKVEASIKPDFNIQTFNKELGKMPLSINVSGDYGNIASFLNEVDCQSYYYDVENFSITRVAKTKDLSVINVNTSGYLYTKK